MVVRNGGSYWSVTSPAAWPSGCWRFPGTRPGVTSTSRCASRRYLLGVYASSGCGGTPGPENGTETADPAEGHRWEEVRFVDCSYLRNLPDGETIPPGRGMPPLL